MAEVFVFGSNLAGVHGAGSARAALQKHGAVWGQGVGRQGNSYAIPTKDEHIRTLPIGTINMYVQDFNLYASQNPGDQFHVVRVGCGLAGFRDEEMAPLFRGAPMNVFLPEEWVLLLGRLADYEPQASAQHDG